MSSVTIVDNTELDTKMFKDIGWGAMAATGNTSSSHKLKL